MPFKYLAVALAASAGLANADSLRGEAAVGRFFQTTKGRGKCFSESQYETLKVKDPNGELAKTCQICQDTFLAFAGKNADTEPVEAGNVAVKEAKERLLCKTGTFTKKTCWLDQTGPGDKDESGISPPSALVGGGKVSSYEDGRDDFYTEAQMKEKSVDGVEMVYFACKVARCCGPTEKEAADDAAEKQATAEAAEREAAERHQHFAEEDRKVKAQLRENGAI